MAKRNAPTARIFAWRDAVRDSTLTPTQRLVAMTWARYTDNATLVAKVGPARLAHDSGYHVSTVKASLRELVELGWLRVVHHGSSKAGYVRTANHYVATVPESFVPVPYSTSGRIPDRVSTGPGVEDKRPGVLTAGPGVEDAPNSLVSRDASRAESAIGDKRLGIRGALAALPGHEEPECEREAG